MGDYEKQGTAGHIRFLDHQDRCDDARRNRGRCAINDAQPWLRREHGDLFRLFRRHCGSPNRIVEVASFPVLGGDRGDHNCWHHNLRLPHAHSWARLSLDLTHPLCRSPDGVGDLVFRPWAR